MSKYNRLLVDHQATIVELLKKIEEVTQSIVLEKPTLFLVDENKKLIGSLSDGDIRRALIKGHDLRSKAKEIANVNFKTLHKKNYTTQTINSLKKDQIKLIPLIDDDGRVVDIIHLTEVKGLLPVDCLIMAGGRGERLKPITDEIPKPLVVIGSKPILEHNIDRLRQCLVKNITLSIRYKGEKIKEYFGTGEAKNIHIGYVTENEPLGTIGALSLIENFRNDNILVMNSDLLTNIDLPDFFDFFISQKAEMAVATIPYKVSVPYAVLETMEFNLVKSFNEKPEYTYYSNAGIYLISKKLVRLIPKNKKFDATDLMQAVIDNKMKLVSYPILGYWLDIGNHKDYEKAKEDIKHIQIY